MIKHKNIALILSAFVGCYSAVFAEEMEANSYSSMTTNMKPNGASGPTLASSLPRVDEYGIHLEVGLILEQFRFSNSDIASLRGGTLMSGVTELTAPYTDPWEYNNMIRIGFDLDAGVRVALGLDTGFDDWRINTVFEWLKGKGSAYGPPVAGGNAGNYLPTEITERFYPESNIPILFGKLDATMSVDYYLFEIMLSRGSYISKRYSIEPFGGIKATWIYTDRTDRFSDDTNTNITMPLDESWLTVLHSDVWGVGPMIGLDSNFYLTNAVSVFSSGNLAVLFGQARTTNYNGIVTDQPVPGYLRVSDLDNFLTFTMRSIIGLQYDTEFRVEKHHFRARAGFDTRYYIAVSPDVRLDADEVRYDGDQLNATPMVEESGNFGMVGLLLDFSVDF